MKVFGHTCESSFNSFIVSIPKMSAESWLYRNFECCRSHFVCKIWSRPSTIVSIKFFSIVRWYHMHHWCHLWLQYRGFFFFSGAVLVFEHRHLSAYSWFACFELTQLYGTHSLMPVPNGWVLDCSKQVTSCWFAIALQEGGWDRATTHNNCFSEYPNPRIKFTWRRWNRSEVKYGRKKSEPYFRYLFV